MPAGTPALVATPSCCGGAASTGATAAGAMALTLESRPDGATQADTGQNEAGRDEASGAADAGGCCATNNPWGYADSKQDYVRRLRRIEGQVRGLQRMVDEDQYCIDILTQISAVTKALESTALKLLDEHLSHCVMHAIEAGGEEADQKLAEASAAIARLVRS
ncbi:hypothetical protein SDC9_117182 [bioreactor metagenome]|uniref:Copper-sensing transcriptional repressor RicR n=2 Tax=root TaxID=1 RepID=A0A645BXX9_9ZZZZ